MNEDRDSLHRGMIDDPDIFRAAMLVIAQHGEAASDFAAGRARELIDKGDIEGAKVWRSILAGVDELQRGRREGEAVN